MNFWIDIPVLKLPIKLAYSVSADKGGTLSKLTSCEAIVVCFVWRNVFPFIKNFSSVRFCLPLKYTCLPAENVSEISASVKKHSSTLKIIRDILSFTHEISNLFLFLLLYYRVKLPWTKAFAALPTISFGFMVCILMSVKDFLHVPCKAHWVFNVFLDYNFCPLLLQVSVLRLFCSITCK